MLIIVLIIQFKLKLESVFHLEQQYSIFQYLQYSNLLYVTCR